jgi:antitoxin HicB
MWSKNGTEAYKININWEIDTWLVTFPDFPEGVADGETQEEALENAVEALEACILFRIEEDAEIPEGSANEGELFVSPRPIIQAKLRLYGELKRQGVKQAELARRMGVSKAQVSRLLDWTHHSRFDEFTKAFKALGYDMVVQIIHTPNIQQSR